MRTITKQYTIYNYQDLLNNPELKQKVLEKHHDINTEFDWYDFTLDDWKQKLEAAGFLNPEIQFTGFWSQGDGASFTCNNIDLVKFMESEQTFTQRQINIIRALQEYNIISFKINRRAFQYSHKYTCYVDFTDYGIRANWNHIQKIIDNVHSSIISRRLYLCDDIYESLEKEYDYLSSEEAIMETLECNDYEFYENGDIAA